MQLRGRLFGSCVSLDWSQRLHRRRCESSTNRWKREEKQVWEMIQLVLPLPFIALLPCCPVRYCTAVVKRPISPRGPETSLRLYLQKLRGDPRRCSNPLVRQNLARMRPSRSISKHPNTRFIFCFSSSFLNLTSPSTTWLDGTQDAFGICSRYGSMAQIISVCCRSRGASQDDERVGGSDAANRSKTEWNSLDGCGEERVWH